MNITKQELLLFEEWKGKRDGFVFDGVVSEIDYLITIEIQPALAIAVA